MTRRVALVVMAKVPEAGQVKTRLCPPLTPDEAASLARCFLLDRVEQLGEVADSDAMVAFAPRERAADMRALVPASVRLVPQAGADLGARLDRVLTDLLAEGYRAAIAVDADSPTLPTMYLRRACAELRDGAADVVVGPCDDGGYYLIGLRVPMPALFADMPWSTSAVTAETLVRARRLGLRLALLPSWFDVDRAADLARLGGGTTPEAFWPTRTRAFLDAIRTTA
jgi:rSAM/selenodomain-associated transferase 1